MTMNMRELPMWLKRCLIYDSISKMFDIPIDASEKVMRHLSSSAQKNSHMMISELKDKIDKYDRKEHIIYMKDESVWYDDPFYDPEIGRGVEGSWKSCNYKWWPSTTESRAWSACPRAFCESLLPWDPRDEGEYISRLLAGRLHTRRVYESLLESCDLGQSLLNSGKNVYNMNIGRVISLCRCRIDFANKQMKDACDPSHLDPDRNENELLVCDFYEIVDPLPSYGYEKPKKSHIERKEQFYKHSEGILETLLEQEMEYYLYLMNSSFLKEFHLSTK